MSRTQIGRTGTATRTPHALRVARAPRAPQMPEAAGPPAGKSPALPRPNGCARSPHRRGSLSADCSRRDERVLVEHDFISQADLDALSAEARLSNRTVFDLLIDKGVYTADEIELCLQTDEWLKRSADDHVAQVISEQAISAYQHEYALNGYFMIEHFLAVEQLRELDLALQRMALAHVEANPLKHKLYHSLGGSQLFRQPATAALIGHPALTAIASAFLGPDLVQGKPYIKVDDPYRYAGMFGHTHAEIDYDCLTRGLYMFLYMDATEHQCGAFQVIPGSHEWYARGEGAEEGRTLFKGRVLESESPLSNKASLVHDAAAARRWAGYESLTMPGNTLLVLSPFLWHAVRPVKHRRRLIFLGFFGAAALTRDFVMRSDYFGCFPYDLRQCELSLLSDSQRGLLAIHLDREAWLKRRGL